MELSTSRIHQRAARWPFVAHAAMVCLVCLVGLVVMIVAVHVLARTT